MLAEGNLGSFTLSSLLGTSRLQTQSLSFRLYLLSLHSILKFNGALSLWSPVVHIVVGLSMPPRYNLVCRPGLGRVPWRLALRQGNCTSVQSVCLSISLSVWLSVCLSVCLSGLPICLSVCLPARQIHMLHNLCICWHNNLLMMV